MRYSKQKALLAFISSVPETAAIKIVTRGSTIHRFKQNGMIKKKKRINPDLDAILEHVEKRTVSLVYEVSSKKGGIEKVRYPS